MRTLSWQHATLAGLLLASTTQSSCRAQGGAPLPAGVSAIWDLGKAYREATPTRERVCINGLWRWQPADPKADQVPPGNWGYFKVPGCWPGITDYLQKDCQTVFADPTWQSAKLGEVTAAWYQREIAIPAGWAGRRTALTAETLNSFATVYVDGRKAGEMRFPAGEVDLTSLCRPGQTHVLSMLVVAMPLKAVMLSFGDSNAAKEVKGSVPRRGLCGDVFLEATPAGERIGDVRVDTSFRKGEITFNVGVRGLADGNQYALRAQITDHDRQVAEFTSEPLQEASLKDGWAAFTARWKPGKLWDIHTPQNQYEASISLLDAGGKVLDTSLPQRFGFRELWIEGRDFYLNGTRVYLSAIPVDNAQISAAASTYEAAKETLLRMKTFGVNMVYTHNYGCEPGAHLSFGEILRAADDVGMLVSLSQPHFGQYDWRAADADQSNGYARDAAFYTRVAGSHPSVVFYSTSHNATGYSDDMNPDAIDGLYQRQNQWSQDGARRALRAEAIISRLDPTRIVYHHSSGNLGSMHTSNFYPNWVPIQEMDDWFEHWATQGVKPLFTCEFAAPGTWDFAMYRGWYKGQRTFGSAEVPWEFCEAEWSSQFLGDRAFQISQTETDNLRWEAAKFRTSDGWYRWDYPHFLGSGASDEMLVLMARYSDSNWRAFRTWGVSATCPWQYADGWKLRPGVDSSRKPAKVDWESLQRPGFSPDYIEPGYVTMVTAYQRSDWIPSPAAQSLCRNNMPLLAYIAGKPAAFTSKDHNFTPGETFEKQLIIINNSRATVTADCRWSLGLPKAIAGSRQVTVETGQQERIPLRFELPSALAPGKYELSATVSFSSGETQTDTLATNVMPKPAAPRLTAKIALFDPKGETAKLLAGMGVKYQPVEANAGLAAYDVLVIGKGALSVDGPGPDVGRVRDGLRVVLFEQTTDVMEKRFGFRTAEYGLRNVFRRVPDHPLLAGLDETNLCDWRGEATIVPPQRELIYGNHFSDAPTIEWCGIEVPQLWRCGTRGSVASVLLEKPAKGDFLPVIDGGYSLQYSPLMVYREGKGLILFCQMDVTGRTEQDPAAEALARNIMRYAAASKSALSKVADRPDRAGRSDRVLYCGGPAGRAYLQHAGLAVADYTGGALSQGQVLVVGSGAGQELAAGPAAVRGFVKAEGRVLALGLGEVEANAVLPFSVGMKQAEHIATYFEPTGANSLLAGIGPADVHNRAPRELPLVVSGAAVVGDGVLATVQAASVAFYQLPPYAVVGADGSTVPLGLRRTYRRASFTLARLLANMGVAAPTPLLARFSSPVPAGNSEKRWLDAYYVDEPIDWDYPYRFFRW